MDAPKFITALFVSFVLVGNCIASDYSPMFEPGYRPDSSTDEGGFWYQVDKLENQVKSSPEVVQDEALNAYVRGLACEIAKEYCDHIRVYIIRSPHFNASMYPNGMMHVWTGLLLRVSSEAELSAVLAHEIAHFLRSHQITQWRKLRSGSSAAIFFDMVLTMGLATLGTVHGAMNFSREQETEADLYGLQLMNDAGFEPSHASNLWKYVYTENENDESKRKRGFFETHPKTENRITELADYEQKIRSSKTHYKINQSTYADKIKPHYFKFMSQHMELKDFGRAEVMLQRHRELGMPIGEVEFFTAEMYKHRNGQGDLTLSIEHYKKSIAAKDTTPPDSYRELGYLLIKQRDKNARQYFERYLELLPEASDKEMILFYLQSI